MDIGEVDAEAEMKRQARITGKGRKCKIKGQKVLRKMGCTKPTAYKKSW